MRHGSGAVVRKPSEKETAVEGTSAVPRVLSPLSASKPIQLQGDGTNLAKGDFRCGVIRDSSSLRVAKIAPSTTLARWVGRSSSNCIEANQSWGLRKSPTLRGNACQEGCQYARDLERSVAMQCCRLFWLQRVTSRRGAADPNLIFKKHLLPELL